MKPIHGAPQPKNVPSDMVDVPPIPCEFSVGDVVTYTNDYGIKFRARVRGFSRTNEPTGFIYLEFWWDWLNAYSTEGSAWWFPHKPDCLKKEST